eukprot:scaffold88735_cov28-Tisochrysis_lutea.AAC.4
MGAPSAEAGSMLETAVTSAPRGGDDVASATALLPAIWALPTASSFPPLAGLPASSRGPCSSASSARTKCSRDLAERRSACNARSCVPRKQGGNEIGEGELGLVHRG